MQLTLGNRSQQSLQLQTELRLSVLKAPRPRSLNQQLTGFLHFSWIGIYKQTCPSVVRCIVYQVCLCLLKVSFVLRLHRRGPCHRMATPWLATSVQKGLVLERVKGASGVQEPHWSACGPGDGCFLASHLKAHNSEAASVVWGRDDRNQVGAVGDVLIVELDRHLVVTCWDRKAPPRQKSQKGISVVVTGISWAQMSSETSTP